ncbi:alpha/beta hydrolase domain-containing protein [Dietzia lutea]|uniref:Alpha/beta hydrolase domain-containing protein n=1 Tax=Dietzia lutea TaxID=546160 RepID=A0A2S1RB16_9ACTN|nr:alpha/beta hydrolase domain-containing protein [Dietzia lutea]AWH93411.1 hypothetical protein A6035_15850 [Dietzia lutea]
MEADAYQLAELAGMVDCGGAINKGQPVEKSVGARYPHSAPFCMLLGRTEVVSDEQLRQLWSDRDEYLRAYTEATDRLIDEGFLMADDRDEILADARPERIT